MEIIDLKKYSKNKLIPICNFGNLIFLREIGQDCFPFDNCGIKDYYFYNLENNEINKVQRDKSKILFDIFHEKKVEGNDALYYITVKKQLFVNDYIINKINIKTQESKSILKFSAENKFNSLNFEVLDNDNILVFFKQEHDLTFEEFENCESPKNDYGYEKSVLYNISNGETFEIKDKNFLKGFRFVFCKTILNNEDCVFYEENYMEPYEKEHIFIDIHMHKKSDKEKFFYKDALKYCPLKQFLKEIREGKEKLSFINIESKGIEGFEFFSGMDENNIYYEINDFGVEGADSMVILNRSDFSKKVIKLPTEFDEDEMLTHSIYTWALEDKYKVIFYQKHIATKTITVKEIISGNINYTYPDNLGFATECMEGRYLITFTQMDDEETSVIDMEKNSMQKFKGHHKVLGDYLFLY